MCKLVLLLWKVIGFFGQQNKSSKFIVVLRQLEYSIKNAEDMNVKRLNVSNLL